MTQFTLHYLSLTIFVKESTKLMENKKVTPSKELPAKGKVSKTWLAMQKGISIGKITDMKAVLK